MTLGQNIFAVIAEMINILKSIFIVPGFSLFTAINLLIWLDVAIYVIKSLKIFGIGGGDDD
jgi:hypothetical protein